MEETPRSPEAFLFFGLRTLRWRDKRRWYGPEQTRIPLRGEKVQNRKRHRLRRRALKDEVITYAEAFAVFGGRDAGVGA